MRPARTSVRIPETKRAAQGRGGPTFRSDTPYGKILLAKVASICDLVLPKTHMRPDRFENMKSLRLVPAGTRSVPPYAIQT